MENDIVIEGAQILTFQALALANAIKLASKGIMVVRGGTPAALMRRAAQITGKKFKRGDLEAAEAALRAWAAERR